MFGGVYDSVEWELGPHGKHLHASCRLDISSSDKLKRATISSHSVAYTKIVCEHLCTDRTII